MSNMNMLMQIQMQMQQRLNGMSPQQTAYIRQWRLRQAQEQAALAGNGQQGYVSGPDHTQVIDMGMGTGLGPRMVCLITLCDS